MAYLWNRVTGFFNVHCEADATCPVMVNMIAALLTGVSARFEPQLACSENPLQNLSYIRCLHNFVPRLYTP